MCIAKNEEAIAIQPNFPESFNNMASAWRVRSFPWESYYGSNVPDFFLHGSVHCFFCYCLLQEKGDIDHAIQCYEHAIQVSVLSDDKPGGKMCVN